VYLLQELLNETDGAVVGTPTLVCEFLLSIGAVAGLGVARRCQSSSPLVHNVKVTARRPTSLLKWTQLGLNGSVP